MTCPTCGDQHWLYCLGLGWQPCADCNASAQLALGGEEQA